MGSVTDQVLRFRMVLVHLVLVVFSVVINTGKCQDYGPVNLDSIDPLSLSWNQIHWLVRDQIKEVEELKAEHDEIYNEIAGCYGLESCLGEFDLVDIQPGSKLWNLGLRRVDLSMTELSRTGGCRKLKFKRTSSGDERKWKATNSHFWN